ncbi:MAG TPA: hypothetical protein VK972_05120, partial [Wenzhouxiangella sp.]|nr:hypothetical protein [Wenzhouxiangella sp.]
MRILSYWLAAIVLLALPAAVSGQVRAFIGAKILPVDGEPIDNGALLVVDGRIDAVGERESMSLPDAAEIIELDTSMVIIPGIVDTHSHIGEVTGADSSGPIQPEARAMDSVNVLSSGLKRALAGGITSVNIIPGSGHLISGQTVYLKLREGNTITDLAYRFEDGDIA